MTEGEKKSWKEFQEENVLEGHDREGGEVFT